MKVAIIGLGSIATKHIHALRVINKNTQIFALRSQQNANNIEGVQNIRELNEVEDLDFVIISNPTIFHYETIKLVAEYGLPMMIEKPAFYDWNGVKELQRFINEHNIFTYVACNLRFHPCLKFLKNKISEKRDLNEVNIYCGSYLPDWRPQKDYRKVYSANKELGGGVHLDLFHEIDYTCWIFGFPNRWNAYTSNASTLAINAPDYANYLLGYDNFNINIILNYYRRKAKRVIEILFENETWEIDLLKNTITNDNNEVIFEVPKFTIIDTYVEQMENFVKELSLSRKSMNDINETIQILKVCLTNEST